MSKSREYAELHATAAALGAIGAANAVVTPMVVVGGKERVVVESGVCGFASVVVSGKSGFGRFMKKAGLARAAYPSGLAIHVRGYGQSLTRKEAYAREYAEVLRKAGVEAYVDARMD